MKVNALNFARAETDRYFARTVKLAGGLATFYHIRVPTPIDKQDVVRMNRDTIYSAAVFDLDAAPVTLTLPDAGKRLMSMLIVNEDHYAQEVVYAPGQRTFTREEMGTRYFTALVRTFVNASDPADVQAANRMQDAIAIQQATTGSFEIPDWDQTTLAKARDALLALNALGGFQENCNRFGKKEEVDAISWLITTAAGWGGNPRADAVYVPVFPANNDGQTAYQLTFRDVPVDGFWSVTVYDRDGFMFANEQEAYSVNNITAKPNTDGSVTIQFGGQFGGDPKDAPNFLAIQPGWNYVVRLYRPQQAILDGTWTVPDLQPLGAAADDHRR
jgi:hypothetical protein